MNEYLSLSTAVNPPEKFLMDGVEYEMYSTDHLSPDEEAAVLSWLSRHDILAHELVLERNPAKGKPIAERLRTARLMVIEKLTNLPRSEAEKLPLSQQAKLLEAIQTIIERETAQDEDDDLREETGADSAEAELAEVEA